MSDEGIDQAALKAGAAPAEEVEPVAWRVKDFADGWILFSSCEAAQDEAAQTDGLLEALVPAAALSRLQAELTEARENAHYATGTADLAMQHRDVAEQRVAELERAYSKEQDAHMRLSDQHSKQMIEDADRIIAAESRLEAAALRERAMREALNFYAGEAKAISRYMQSGKQTDALVASMTVLSLDAGKRAALAQEPSK